MGYFLDENKVLQAFATIKKPHSSCVVAYVLEILNKQNNKSNLALLVLSPNALPAIGSFDVMDALLLDAELHDRRTPMAVTNPRSGILLRFDRQLRYRPILKETENNIVPTACEDTPSFLGPLLEWETTTTDKKVTVQAFLNTGSKKWVLLIPAYDSMGDAIVDDHKAGQIFTGLLVGIKELSQKTHTHRLFRYDLCGPGLCVKTLDLIFTPVTEQNEPNWDLLFLKKERSDTFRRSKDSKLIQDSLWYIDRHNINDNVVAHIRKIVQDGLLHSGYDEWVCVEHQPQKGKNLMNTQMTRNFFQDAQDTWLLIGYWIQADVPKKGQNMFDDGMQTYRPRFLFLVWKGGGDYRLYLFTMVDPRDKFGGSLLRARTPTEFDYPISYQYPNEVCKDVQWNREWAVLFLNEHNKAFHSSVGQRTDTWKKALNSLFPPRQIQRPTTARHEAQARFRNTKRKRPN